jgi:hypothetical protein
MDDWFGPFLAILEFNSDLVVPPQPDVPSAIDETKTVWHHTSLHIPPRCCMLLMRVAHMSQSVLEMARLFVDKYEEDTQKFIQGFCEKSFKLLTSLSEKARYDQVWSLSPNPHRYDIII